MTLLSEIGAVDAPPHDGTFWAGDVIIVGAGASGLLAARELVASGHRVVIIEKTAVGAAQSNHSHGYMHRGHIYLQPSSALVENLGRGADRWRQIMAGCGIQPTTTHGYLGFTNPYEAEVAARSWAARGLSFTAADTPRSLASSEFRQGYLTEEETYDFTPWLAASAASLADEGVQFIHGEVRQLNREDQNITGVVVETGGTTITLGASYVLLCAGIGNLGLASTATRFKGQALNRTSLMLVLENPDLDLVSIVAHGHQTRGLFSVSRTVNGTPVWLVSNYVSYATEYVTADATTLWLRDIRRTLLHYTKALENSHSRWGYYPAAKGELRSMRNVIDGHNVQRYGLNNLCVASPTKLTLAPLLADSVTRSVTMQLRPVPRGRGMRDLESNTRTATLAVADETWKSAPLSPIQTLMAL